MVKYEQIENLMRYKHLKAEDLVRRFAVNIPGRPSLCMDQFWGGESHLKTGHIQ